MQGLKTIAVGLGMVVLPVALQYLAGIDWKQYVPPEYAPMIAGSIMIAMRLVTKTPVFNK